MQRKIFNATILAGASLSDPIDLGAYTLAGIVVPDNWTAADITFRGGVGADYNWPVLDQDGAEVTIDAVADSMHIFPPNLVVPTLGFVRVRSGTNASPVVQTTTDKIVGLIGVIP